MAKLTTRELEDALREFVLTAALGPASVELNWHEKKNSELAVGDKIVTKFDRRSGRAIAGVKIIEATHNPRGCRSHVHVKGDNTNINGCYDYVARTRVFNE